MLETLTEASFAPLVGSRCKVFAPAGAQEAEPPALDLEIASVAVVGKGTRGRRDPFSVQFLGPPGRALPQRIYPIEIERLGRLDLFLVPLGPEPDGRQRYEAIFT